MSRAWMPFYVADYLADTGHLTTAEHGAYLLLIMHYWSNGGLPDDDKKLARIVRMSPSEWAEARETLSEFFQDGWSHKRIDAEFARAAEKSQKAAASASKRWDANAMRTHSDGNANAMLPQSQSQSDISTDVDIAAPAKPKRARPKSKILEDAQPTDRDRQSASDAGLSGEAFRTEWRRFRDYHISRGSLMADWPAAWRTWVGNHNRFAKQARAGPSSNGKGGMASLLAKQLGLKDGREGRNSDEAVHVLSLDHRAERGNERDDGRQLSGDVIDLLSLSPVRSL